MDIQDSLTRDRAEYTLAIIEFFAGKNGLTEMQAYRYFKWHDGISLIEEHYNIMHTLSFADAVESLTTYMNHRGGKIPYSKIF